MIRPTGNIFARQDGDVVRILDSEGRGYTAEGLWEAAPEYPPGLDDAPPPDFAAWEKRTAFSWREAELLVDVLKREQRAVAVADELARGIAAIDAVSLASRKWLSRRNDA